MSRSQPDSNLAQFIQNHKKTLFITGGVLLACFWFLFIVPRTNVPSPVIHNYLILEGGVSRAIVLEGHTNSVKSFMPRLPHHLTFESNPGPVDVYVLDFSLTDPTQIERMMTMTNELQSEQPPKEFVANAKGVTGRIDLHSWPYGWAKYLVLMRAGKDSEVTLKVQYGP